MPEHSSSAYYQLEQIVERSLIRRVFFHRKLDSTNDWAFEHIDDLSGHLPALVLTDLQTAGRGRGANVWQSEPGNLACSIVLRSDAIAGTDSPASRVDWESRAWWPLLTGLAVATAADELLSLNRAGSESPDAAEEGSGPKAWIKWPNDVMLLDRKLAGVLVESAGRSELVVVGIGVNLARAPVVSGSKAPAIALSEVEDGAGVEPHRFLLVLLDHFAKQLERCRSDPHRVIEACRERCWLRGRTVRIRVGDQVRAGRVSGLGDRGTLLIESRGQISEVASGEIVDASN